MNELKTYKDNAIKATREYQNELLKEFLLKSASLSEKLSALIQNGVDDEHYVCLEDAEVEDDSCYTILIRKDAIELKAVLDGMDANNAIEKFKDLEQQQSCAWFADMMLSYPDFEEMEELATAYNDCTCLLIGME